MFQALKIGDMDHDMGDGHAEFEERKKRSILEVKHLTISTTQRISEHSKPNQSSCIIISSLILLLIVI